MNHINNEQNQTNNSYAVLDAELQQAREEAAKRARKAAAKKRKQIFSKKARELNELREKLLDEVVGQDHAIDAFVSGLFEANLNEKTAGCKKITGPKAVYTFMGAPGMGKTLLAKTAAEHLGLPYKRLDMTSFADRSSFMGLVGSEFTWKHSSPGDLTTFVHENPKCILLFDEIEKAHDDILKLIYPMIDEGYITDKYMVTYGDPDEADYEKWDTPDISFKDAIIIFTSNVGRTIYEDPAFSDGSAVSEKTMQDAMMNEIDPNTAESEQRKLMPTALVSRLSTGKLIMFNRLGVAKLSKVMHKILAKTFDRYEREIGIKTTADRDLETALMFSVGGALDARQLSKKSETFLAAEFNKITSAATEILDDVEDLKIEVIYPGKNGETANTPYSANSNEALKIKRLFVADEKCKALAYVDNDIAKLLKEDKGLKVTAVDNTETAKALANNEEFDFVLIDAALCNNGGDIGKTSLMSPNAKRWSEGRGLFDAIRKTSPEMPVYILNCVLSEDDELPESVTSEFARNGSGGIVVFDGDAEGFAEKISELAETVHKQQSANMLARSHQYLAFRTAFEPGEKACSLTIKLRDFTLERAPLADDLKNIVSSADIPKERFSDVVGANLAVKALGDFKQFFENPRKFVASGRKAPKGVLLYGEPGTGKTMLAKAMAGECDAAFFQKSAAQLNEPKDVEKLFESARKYAPSIIFIDEVDTIAMPRTSKTVGLNSIVNAILTQMEGFKEDTKRPVFVLAATNFYPPDATNDKEKMLDAAFCRRFDRAIYVDLPDTEARAELIRRKLAKMNSALGGDDVQNLAERMPGYSPSKINNILEAAKGLACNDINTPNNEITIAHIEQAIGEIKNGEARENRSDEELRAVAIHEAGHTLIYHLSGHKASYVTVEARGHYGGYMQRSEEEMNKPRKTREDLLDSIRCSLGGRAAESVVYGKELGINTGAAGDLEHATTCAQFMTAHLGFDEEFGMSFIKPDLAESSEAVRKHVNEILKEEFENAQKLIEANKDKLLKLTCALVERKYLPGYEIEKILAED